MNFDNLQVKHKIFGLGTIVAKDGKYFTVSFAVGEKKFVYPDSFGKFLTLADGTVPEAIALDLNASLEAKRLIQEKKHEEMRHSMLNGIVIPGKETTVDSEDEETRYKNSESEDI